MKFNFLLYCAPESDDQNSVTSPENPEPQNTEVETRRVDPNRGETAFEHSYFYKVYSYIFKINHNNLVSKWIMCFSLDSTSEKGNRHSEQWSTQLQTRYEKNILLFNQTPLMLHSDKKLGHFLKFEKKHQETGSALTVNICIVSERMSH